MAFFDWDGDGKKDIWDTAMEYKIYKSIFEDDDEEENADDLDDSTDDF